MREEGSTVKAGSFSESKCTALLPCKVLYQVLIHIIQYISTLCMHICIYAYMYKYMCIRQLLLQTLATTIFISCLRHVKSPGLTVFCMGFIQELIHAGQDTLTAPTLDSLCFLLLFVNQCTALGL